MTEERLIELTQAFTCAGCGHLDRFRPSAPHPCPGCGQARWILGLDSKLFEWKAGLATLRRSDRGQIAKVILGEMATLPDDPSDPIAVALSEVRKSGFDEAAEIQQC